MTQVLMRDRIGSTVLPVDRWTGPATGTDRAVLDLAVGPVLDIGCGPGRHVRALNERGVPALGIDAAPSAVQLARERGCAALERSVFERVPAAGRWGTVLLLDGNVGIGGDPHRLVGRARELLGPGGYLLAEADAPGTGLVTGQAQLEIDGLVSPWFPWARIGVDRLAALARGSGLHELRRWSVRGRWFLQLRRPIGARP